MKRIGRYVVVLVIATALGAAGCSSPTTTLRRRSTRHHARHERDQYDDRAVRRPAPTASAAALIEFSTDGAGPYQLGLTLTQLQAKPGLEEVTTGGVCPNNTIGARRRRLA